NVFRGAKPLTDETKTKNLRNAPDNVELDDVIADLDVHQPWLQQLGVPPHWQERLRRWVTPRNYQLTRWLILRLLGFVYVFAFLGLILQGPGLLESHGLTPIGTYVDLLHEDHQTFWDVPSLFMWGQSDTWFQMWAYIGLGLGLAVLVGYANLSM